MILTRFGSTVFIRASAIVAVFIGLLYMPSVFFLPITGLGPELAGGQRIAELWAMYAVYGGIGLFLGSFLLNVARTVGFKRISRDREFKKVLIREKGITCPGWMSQSRLFGLMLATGISTAHIVAEHEADRGPSHALRS